MIKTLGRTLASLTIFVGLVACGSSSDNSSGNGDITGIVTLPNTVSQAVIVHAGSEHRKANKAPVDSADFLATASGTVPVPGATCTVEGTDKSGTTDQNGLFAINGVSPGIHILICKKDVADGSTYAFLKIVEVLGGQTLDIGALEITLAGKIQGSVALAGQANSAGVKVYIPGTSLQATTDTAGAYVIPDVPVGSFDIRFESAGYSTVTLSGVAVTAGQTTSVNMLTLNLSTGATGSIEIAEGGLHSTSKTVSAAITASSDATLMQISEDPTFVNAIWQPVTTTLSYSFATDGQKRLYIKFSDANGLESAPVSDDIIIDTTPPADTSISINLGSSATNTTSVTLSLVATDATTSVSQMMISNSSDFAVATWETFSGTQTWTLPSGDGTKTVYAKFKDIVSNETITAVSASILLDTQAPSSSGATIQEGAFTNVPLIHLSLTASEAVFMKISEDPQFIGIAPVPYAATSTYTLSDGNGSKTVYVRFLDEAGNFTDVTLSPILLDTTPYPQYPQNGLSGQNLLYGTENISLAQGIYDLAADLPQGSALKIVITLNAGSVWGYEIPPYNWYVTQWNNVDQTFTALESGKSCNARFMIFQGSIFTIQYFENNTTTPTRTKQITVI